MQCRFNFRDRQAAFASDYQKVNFALSYLKDSAAAWFEPALSGLLDDDPNYLYDWDKFVEELRVNFGPYDEAGDAEAALSNLKMKDNQRISDYLVQFKTLSARCEWSDQPLRYQFYSGLPTRLKDDISRGEYGKPKNLRAMIAKAQQADARYWERRSEISRENPSDNKPSDNKNARSGNNSSTNNNGNSQSDNKSDNKASNDKKGKGKQSDKSQTSDKPDLTNILGTDGKLLPQEKQRRMDNKLCLLCTDPGHRVTDCPKNTKARSTKTTTAPAQLATESKKE